MTQASKPKPTIRFNAELQELKTGAFLVLPKTVSAKLPVQKTIALEGSLNGIPFQTSVESDGKGNLVLKVTKAMLGVTGVKVGTDATVEIVRVGDEAESRVPADLYKAISVIPKALDTWNNNTFLARRDWIYWFISAKQAETRKRRIDKACDILGSGKKRVCCFGGVNWLMKHGK